MNLPGFDDVNKFRKRLYPLGLKSSLEVNDDYIRTNYLKSGYV